MVRTEKRSSNQVGCANNLVVEFAGDSLISPLKADAVPLQATSY